MFSPIATAHAQESVFQLFAGTGEVVVRGDAVAEVQMAGIATIRSLDAHLFVRPYLAAGVINPDKAKVDDFKMLQGGALIGYKVTPRFAVLAGASVTVLSPDGGREYRPTLNLATATVVKKFKAGTLQVMTPVSINWLPTGDRSTTWAVAAGWTF